MIVDGLLTTLQVDDREPAHREADRAVDVETIVVRTAMTDRVVHPRQSLRRQDAHAVAHLPRRPVGRSGVSRRLLVFDRGSGDVV